MLRQQAKTGKCENRPRAGGTAYKGESRLKARDIGSGTVVETVVKPSVFPQIPGFKANVGMFGADEVPGYPSCAQDAPQRCGFYR